MTGRPHVFTRSVTESLKYLLYFPEDMLEKPLPLVLYLHGGGESGSELRLLQTKGLPKLLESGMSLPALVLAPQNPHPEGFFPEQLLSDLLDEITTTYPVDLRRVYLTGYSRGGFAAWQLAMRRPESFAALVPVAAGGLSIYAFWVKQIPVWAFHGALDRVVPPVHSASMVKALRNAGGQAKHSLVSGADHDNILDYTYCNPALYRWLFQQTKRC